MNTNDVGTATIKIEIDHISREEFEKLNRSVKWTVQEWIQVMNKRYTGKVFSTFDSQSETIKEPVRIPVDDALPTPIVELQAGLDLFVRSVVKDELSQRK
jgi:hypothetical protein